MNVRATFRQLGLIDLAGYLTVAIPLSLIIGRALADIFASTAALLFLIDSVRRKDWEWTNPLWVKAAAALWLYGAIRNSILSHSDEGLLTSIVWFRYVLFAACAATRLLTEDIWKKRLFLSAALSAGFLGLDSIYQYVFKHDIIGQPLFAEYRLTAIYKRPMAGISIANLLAFALYGLIDRKRWVSIVLGGICLLAVLLSGERMALLYAATLVLPWLFFLIKKEKKLLLLPLAAAALAGILFTVQPQLFERQVASIFKTSHNIGASPYGQVWKTGIAVGLDNPLFGVGIHRFRDVCPDEKYGPAVIPETGVIRCYIHTHNTYLEWFSEGGFIGLSLYVVMGLCLLIPLFQRLAQHNATPVLWGTTTMLALRLMPLFITTSFFNNWSAIPFWLAVGLAYAEKGKACVLPKASTGLP